MCVSDAVAVGVASGVVGGVPSGVWFLILLTLVGVTRL